MQCPACTEKFSARKIKKVRDGQQGMEFQCPHCSVWLFNEPKMVKLKMFGALVMLVSAVSSFFVHNEQLLQALSWVTFSGAIIALFAIYKGKLIKA